MAVPLKASQISFGVVRNAMVMASAMRFQLAASLPSLARPVRVRL